MIACPKNKQQQAQDRKTQFETMSLPVAEILSRVARRAPTNFDPHPFPGQSQKLFMFIGFSFPAAQTMDDGDDGRPGTTGDDRGRPGTTGDDRGRPGTTGDDRGRPGTTGDDRLDRFDRLDRLNRLDQLDRPTRMTRTTQTNYAGRPGLGVSDIGPLSVILTSFAWTLKPLFMDLTSLASSGFRCDLSVLQDITFRLMQIRRLILQRKFSNSWKLCMFETCKIAILKPFVRLG